MTFTKYLSIEKKNKKINSRFENAGQNLVNCLKLKTILMYVKKEFRIHQYNCIINLWSVLLLFQVEYDFQYYKMEMATDAQMLIFSEGKSNIMPADLVVPFQPSQVNSLQVITPETAEAWRCYLATCKSLSNSIGEELQQVLENDLVELRQTDRSLGSQDLSRY